MQCIFMFNCHQYFRSPDVPLKDEEEISPFENYVIQDTDSKTIKVREKILIHEK